MRIIKGIWTVLKTFMILFSFIVSLVLVAVIVVLLVVIFDIKRNIAEPLVGGLHSSFVGLDQATIDWTIPVRDTIPVVLNVPLNTDTVVVLTDDVPLFVSANITLPGLNLANASVALTLPEGLELPVRLSLDVPINEQLDIALDVRAVIPLRETQLHDPFDNLRLLFEPLVRGLYNLPNDWEGARQMAAAAFDGNAPNLLAANAQSDRPWPGFSTTAGVGYALGDQAVPILNLPQDTGIVPIGGIPALDEQLRPEIYAQGGPRAINGGVGERLAGSILPSAYDGSFAANMPPRLPPEVVPLETPIMPIEPLPTNGGSIDPNTTPTEAPIDPNAAPTDIGFTDPNTPIEAITPTPEG